MSSQVSREFATVIVWVTGVSALITMVVTYISGSNIQVTNAPLIT